MSSCARAAVISGPRAPRLPLRRAVPEQCRLFFARPWKIRKGIALTLERDGNYGLRTPRSVVTTRTGKAVEGIGALSKPRWGFAESESSGRSYTSPWRFLHFPLGAARNCRPIKLVPASSGRWLLEDLRQPMCRIIVGVHLDSSPEHCSAFGSAFFKYTCRHVTAR